MDPLNHKLWELSCEKNAFGIKNMNKIRHSELGSSQAMWCCWCNTTGGSHGGNPFTIIQLHIKTHTQGCYPMVITASFVLDGVIITRVWCAWSLMVKKKEATLLGDAGLGFYTKTQRNACNLQWKFPQRLYWLSILADPALTLFPSTYKNQMACSIYSDPKPKMPIVRRNLS